MSALDLLSGDAQVFREKIWASRVQVHTTDPERLTRHLTLDDVDHLLTDTAIRAPAVRLAQDGSVLAQSRYTRHATLAGQTLTGLVDARKVIDLFEGGATVVLQGLHRYWAPLTRLVRELELELGHPCQANAYLTPPGSQGFALHSDTHDVFVFQTHGRKVWEIHEDGEPRGVELEPGVAMYMPTGTPHCARTEDAASTASLHVTLGINQFTWRTLLDRAVAAAMPVTGSDHLPAGYLHDPAALRSGLADRLRTLADALTATDVDDVVAGHRDSFLTGRVPALRGGLRDRLLLDGIDDATRLRRRPTAAGTVVDHGDDVRVLLGDRDLTMPGWVRPALEHAVGSDELAPGDLSDWLDHTSRVVLCRRLVREGMFEVVS